MGRVNKKMKPTDLRVPHARTRAHALVRLQRELQQRAFPRFQMGLMVALTGAFGLLSSYLLLQVGVDSMTVRYPLALAVAYLFFLLLLWLWLRTKAEDYLEAIDVITPTSSPDGVCHAPSMTSGNGGDFAGGGSSGTFEGAGSPVTDDLPNVSGVGDAIGSAAEADEFAVPLIAIVLALGLALASLYVVWLAPTLLAELMLDGALSYALYRHFRGVERRHWVETAVRRTVGPLGLTMVFVSLLGAAMSAYAPGAHSLGEVIQHAQRQQHLN